MFSKSASVVTLTAGIGVYNHDLNNPCNLQKTRKVSQKSSQGKVCSVYTLSTFGLFLVCKSVPYHYTKFSDEVSGCLAGECAGGAVGTGGADAADVDGRLFLAAGMGAWLPVVEVALALTA